MYTYIDLDCILCLGYNQSSPLNIFMNSFDSKNWIFFIFVKYLTNHSTLIKTMEKNNLIKNFRKISSKSQKLHQIQKINDKVANITPLTMSFY